MARIAVDIDSTLYDFETPAREAFLTLAEKYDDKSLFMGAYHPWTEWRSPADVCGLDRWLEAIAICHDEDAILAQKPFAGAVETCHALQEEGHTLLYISNRATEATDATREWLDRCGFLREHAEVIALMGDKKPHMAECQYLIDDRPKTAIEFVYDHDWHNGIGPSWDGPDLDGPYDDYYSKHARRAFVKAYPYNQNLTDIPKMYLAPTWAGLNYYLVSKGVLSKPAALPALTV